MFVLATRGGRLRSGLPATAAALRAVVQHASGVGVDVDDAAREADFVSDLALETHKLRRANHRSKVGSLHGDISGRIG